MEHALKGKLHGAATESLFRRKLGQVGVVVLFGEVRKHEVTRLPIEDFRIGEEFGHNSIGKVPCAAHHALLDVPGIRANLEHLEIVIRFENQHIRFAEVVLYQLRHVSKIGDDGDLATIRPKRVAHRIGRVVRNGEGIYFDVAYLEPLTRTDVINLLHLAHGTRGIHLQDAAMRGFGEIGRAAPFARHLAKGHGVIGVFVGDEDGVNTLRAGATERVKTPLHFLPADSGIDEKGRRLSFQQRSVARASRGENRYAEPDVAALSRRNGKSNGSWQSGAARSKEKRKNAKKAKEVRYSRDSEAIPMFFSPAAFLSLYFLTQAAKLLPAAVSRPVKAIAAISLYGIETLPV
jgi:hypothetical protein